LRRVNSYANNNPYKYFDPDGRQAEGASQAGLALHGSLPRSQQRTIAMVAGGIMFAPVAALLGPREVASMVIEEVTGVELPSIKGAVKKIIKKACCFVAGTQVLTESGYKNIEDVVLGEKLWAKNTETGEQDWKPVTKIFNEPDRGIYEINLMGQDGFKQKIQATDDHPFFVIDKGWKTTIELEVGDLIETDGNGAMTVTNVIDEQRLDLTYNFTVADFHTYYVTKRNVLVHNCGIQMKGRGSAERTSGSDNTITQAVSDAGYNSEKLNCAQCKLTQSIKSRKADLKRQTNKSSPSYKTHKDRKNLEEKALGTVNKKIKELGEG
jgi:hypothetical protein